MDGSVEVAIFGAPINNSNLGCLALTYSLVSLLCKIEEELKIKFNIHLFEMHPNEAKADVFCKVAGVSRSALHVHKVGVARDFKNFIRHGKENIEMIRVLHKCKFAIDLTEGDSFADIYGSNRYKSQTNIKRIVEKIGLPLFLGPQTYGPFERKESEDLAALVMKNARIIIARDELSADLVESLTGTRPVITTDLAFQLPYRAEKNSQTNRKLAVGINISGLLTKHQFEGGNNSFEITVDYDAYIDKILNYLVSDEQYEVYLIPHVKNDVEIIHLFNKKYPQTRCMQIFDNPIDIKSQIASMDIFIGSRMHACIAAFTSGVPTIPAAYSRKFNGLFDLVEYYNTVDLTVLSTDEAFEKTIKLINNFNRLKQEVDNSLEISEKYSMILYTTIKEEVLKIIR